MVGTDTRAAYAGCDLSIEIMLSNGGNRQVLIYGHPPTLMDEQEFSRKYREAKELP
jgi:hypothetical protein